ncbi:uncharacterized protein LOC128413490 [Podarcis raffonei]|nr:uncharacterized protein LOC128413490 [Podarcis raffonei]
MAFFLKGKKKNKIYPSYEDEAPALLPALAKPSTSATEGRRKDQVARKNKIYPSYEDEAPALLPALAKPSTSAAEARPAEARPLVLPGLVKPQTSKQDPSQQRPSKKKSLEDSGPALPELSDENFEYLWMGKKILGGRTIREALEMMDEREILDTILQHLQPPPQNALYRYYGLKLRDSRSAETVHQYLHLLLTLPLEEEADREEVIKEEPMASLTILHQAMETIIRMTALRPRMDPLLRSQLLQKTIRKVFQLPSLQVTKVKAGSSVPATQSQDCFQETIYIWLNMLTSLLSEAPSLETLQEILVHTNGWIDSTKISERQRAVKTTNVLMKYVSEHLDFDVSQDFPLLGQLVALLSLHLADNVKEIGLQSAEALYHLHYIMIAKMGKELEKRRNKNKKGNMVRWVREDFFIPGPSLFHYHIAKVAKAFGEHLKPSQINEVVLKAIDNLTVEDRAVSQAAGKLLRSFLEECGMEMEDLPMVVKEIYNHLHQIPDTRTKEETLSAIVSLATKRLQPVVDSLLDCSMECDE